MSSNLLEVGAPYWVQGEQNYNWPLNIWTNAFAASLKVKTAPGKLYGFSVYNSNVATQFVLLFDAVAVPGAGAPAVMAYPVATLSTLLVSFGDTGRAFNTGCVLANSSTPSTLTAGAADCMFDAQYL